ncbi:MAG: glycosyltransferase family 2 protein [Candidatus Shapirobacteria bacterium]|nr:glycosyltransferase family 2 protein [Candidatus Shapirobacteria bacterium]
MIVSLIIPAFNEEKYIDQCLNSILLQTRIPDEIVICNNASTDNTVKVASKYLKKLPLKIVTESQKGIAPALQTAYLASTGDVLLRTDADTLLPKDWVKDVISHFETDPKLDVCGGDVYALGGNIFYKTMYFLSNYVGDLYSLPFHHCQYLFGANTAFRRQVLKKINGYCRQGCPLPEDQMMCHKLSQHHFKIRRFTDCYNLTSIRRFKRNPKEVICAFLAIINPTFYREKSA